MEAKGNLGVTDGGDELTIRRALTTKTVEAIKPDPNQRLELPDPALSGLYLVVQPSGAKSWALRYRYAGKPKKLTLGRWPVMGLADARAAASNAIEAVDYGNDPSAAKKATKAARLETQLSERDKIKTLVEKFGARHLSTLKSGETVKRELNRHVVAIWGGKGYSNHYKARRDRPAGRDSGQRARCDRKPRSGVFEQVSKLGSRARYHRPVASDGSQTGGKGKEPGPRVDRSGN